MRLKAYKHLYERIETVRMDGKPTGRYVWSLKPDARGEWRKHLLPKHDKFLRSLDDWQQLCVCLSADPFDALRTMWLERKKNGDKKSQE